MFDELVTGIAFSLLACISVVGALIELVALCQTGNIFIG
jgi:hypothetical protein